jgi:hypothetical protein
MGNLLNIIAIVLLIAWAIGYFAFSIGGFIHILLAIAIITFIIRALQRDKIL